MTSQIFTPIEQLIAAKKRPNVPIIVGVNGIDLSGKTTFTLGLAAWLRGRGRPVQAVHLDDFHNPLAVRRQGRDPVDAYIHNAFNLETLISQVLAPIREQGELDTTLTLLNLESDAYTNRQSYLVAQDTIVLLEGVLLFRPPVDEYLDVRIFLEISFNEMLRRAAARDAERFGRQVLARYREKYIPVQQWYSREYQPRHKADLVINN